ncbi:hypothetical protein V1514DRAFT_303706 [Lipomyces japonicus]|uniref:uncharacterized protein n=1 Tax=Lipomyces japonicus TaxID=56871 RepID=UPI0034D01CF4
MVFAQPKKTTYGRRAHRQYHFQGLAETDLWNRASPTKKKSFVAHSADNLMADNHKEGPIDVQATTTENLANGSFSNKENNVPFTSGQSPRKSHLAKIKRVLSSTKLDNVKNSTPSSPRTPLLMKNANRSELDNQQISNASDIKLSQNEKISYVIPKQQKLNLSDLSACLEILSDADGFSSSADPQQTEQTTFLTERPVRLDSVQNLDGPLYLPESSSSLSSSSSPILSDLQMATKPSDEPSTPTSIPVQNSVSPQLSPVLELTQKRASLASQHSPQTTLTLDSPQSSSLTTKNRSSSIGIAKPPLASSPLRQVMNANAVSEPTNKILSELDHLLQNCSINHILGFEEYINSLLPVNEIKKLGEASYSEVFSMVDKRKGEKTVLKIIPFGKNTDELEQVNVLEITNELKISKTLMQFDGYVQLVGAYIVRGAYSSTLLDLWDIFAKEKQSENDRPDFYDNDQLYCVIVLKHAGTDLENFELKSWTEAAIVFWKTAKILAEAEQKVWFEHRDLHWGNIVLDREEDLVAKMDGLSLSPENENNISVTIIDYTLSRAVCDGEMVCTSMDDPSIYVGRGDYQFDIYRFLRKLFNPLDNNEDDLEHQEDVYLPGGKKPRRKSSGRQHVIKYDWTEYQPKTNVLWLHYLTERLIFHKNLPMPRLGRQSSRNNNSNSVNVSSQDVVAYKVLDNVYRTIDPRKKKFGSKKNNDEISSAEQLVRWATDNDMNP